MGDAAMKQMSMAGVAIAFLESGVRLIRLGELDAAREAIAQASAALGRLPRAKGGK